MNIGVVLREISSTACQEIIKEIWSIVERVQEKTIVFKQGNTEIAGCKHIIQTLALDWEFKNMKKNLKKRIGGHK